MVKIPGTKEGVPAIEAALTEGININITLLFSIAHYEAVAKAYITAVERRLAKGDPIDRLASVASFFVSRIDTEADKRLEKIGSDEAKALKGKVAVANAQLAYELFQELFESDAFKELQSKGASVQRPLWASTGTKNPAYSDVLYVDTLIGPDTVNTMPIKTMQAFLDHGTLKRTVDADYAGARQVLADLQQVGVSLDDITQQLEDEGIDKFIQSYDELLEGVAQKRSQLAEKVGAK
jgi:transaldolase/glucose-6-phosphate isomerase